jgi:hypothetical protein
MEEQAGQPPPRIQLNTDVSIDEAALAKFRERFLNEYGGGHWKTPDILDDVRSPTGTPDIRGMAALKMVLARLRYRNGWRFELLPPDVSHEGEPDDSPMPWHRGQVGILHVMFDAEDSRERGRPRRQNFRVAIPSYPGIDEATEGRWIEWLFGIIAHVEVHEVAEFFEIAGPHGWERPFDPHKDEQRAATRIAGRGLPRTL